MQLPGATAPYPITDSAVVFEAQEIPTDPALAFFDCGTGDTADAINRFFRTGAWASQPQLVALRFVLHGARIGYAAVRLSEQPYPDSQGATTATYLALWMMGLDLAFQGSVDPGSSTKGRLVDSILRGVESVAHANSTAGISLWVREANSRARTVYARNGFIEDPRGVFLGRNGVPMLEMRRNFGP